MKTFHYKKNWESFKRSNGKKREKGTKRMRKGRGKEMN